MAEKEYIERAALEHQFMTKRQYLTKDMVMDAAYEINKFPAADVAPVVHGRWEEMHYEGGILDGTNFDRCSVCGYERVFDDPAFKTVFKYCPNCGAMMDGGSE